MLASLLFVSHIFFHLISNMQTTSEVDTLSNVNIIQVSKILVSNNRTYAPYLAFGIHYINVAHNRAGWPFSREPK